MSMRFEDVHDSINVKLEYNVDGDGGYGVQTLLTEVMVPKTFNYINDCIDNFMNGLGKLSYYFETSDDRESFGQLKEEVRKGILENFADSVSTKYKTIYKKKVKVTARAVGELKVSLKYG